MPAHTRILYHIVFATYLRKPVLLEARQPELWGYLAGILTNKHCHPYRVGGFTDHLHILTSLHPSVSLASLVQDLKVASNLWIRSNNVFPGFERWCKKYFAATVDYRSKEGLINYILNQKAHHTKVSLDAEYGSLCRAFDVETDARYSLWE